jgi:hypothetical protein
MFNMRSIHGFLGVRRHEDLNGVVVIADGALIERSLDASSLA